MKKNIYSVSKVNEYIAGMFQQDFLLADLAITGEISNCKYHSSGHIYFTLKDEHSSIAGIMFAGYRRGLQFPMRDGDQVVVRGSIEVYRQGGKYQIYAKEITLAGAGDLYQRFEALKKELEEMGMFAPEYKKPIPQYATRIGVVTAPTGAAVRDIIQISKKRNPHIQIVLYPALVQGDGAVASIVNGIRLLDTMNLDTIIVGRGGGSIEDLWAFNEEAVARAIFECETPIISAVGHQTDTTIADYVADVRAATPSHGAELAVFEYQQFYHQLMHNQMRMQHMINTKVLETRNEQKHLQDKLRYLSPQNQLNTNRQYLLELERKMQNKMQYILEGNKSKLSLYAERLDGLSPAKKLQMGYSYVTGADEKNVTKASQIATGDVLTIYFSEGYAKTKVIEKVDK